MSGERALLAAYPARLRRKHGAELIATMAEMTGGRPSRADRGRLVLDGLRERFRPPAGRPLAVLAAVVALLIGGALGAAAGSWLGTFGYAPLPDAEGLGQRVLPGFTTGSQSEHYLYAGGTIDGRPDAAPAAERVRAKLAAEGWRTGPIRSGAGNVHFGATTADTRIDVYAYHDGIIDIAGWPLRPAGYLPLTLTGALLGLVAGWLAGVALTHRIRAARRPRRSAVLAGVGLALALPSAAGFVASLVRYLTVADPTGTGELLHANGFAFGPTIDWMRAYDMGEGWFLTPGDLQTLPVWGFALIAVAAVVARRRTEFDGPVPIG